MTALTYKKYMPNITVKHHFSDLQASAETHNKYQIWQQFANVNIFCLVASWEFQISQESRVIGAGQL